MEATELKRLRARLLDPETSEETGSELVLACYEEHDDDALDLLMEVALQATQLEARADALDSLGHLGNSSSRAFDAVLESLSPHEPARVLSAALVSAIKMSRVIGERTDELVARLEQLLERPEDEVRGLVRSAAAKIYGEDHPIARSGPRPKMLDLGSLPIDHAIYGGGWEISSHPKFGRA